MIKLCVFDMDGLLLDSERQMYLRSGVETSKELGRPIEEAFLTTLMGGSWTAYEKGILDNYGSDYPMDKYWEIFDKKVDQMINYESIPLRPGVIEVLDYCKEKGIQMAVATSTLYDDAIKCLSNSKLIDYFGYIVTGDMVEKTKPNPEVFLKAIEHFDISVNESLVFEDGHNGAHAAKNGNCRLILVEDLAYLSDEDKEYAEMVIDNINKVIEHIDKENETASSL
ncbi:MAG: HAD family phosphatase [Erysipelotrichaceae bacterium]|nr:HAD family phosphatase [Erysipelotrichaceae bacterium]